jgi:hypothetical protein
MQMLALLLLVLLLLLALLLALLLLLLTMMVAVRVLGVAVTMAVVVAMGLQGLKQRLSSRHQHHDLATDGDWAVTTTADSQFCNCSSNLPLWKNPRASNCSRYLLNAGTHI